jgi:hypothetical protein
MSEHIDLKSLERKAYTSYHQDGLIDIFLGLAIIFFGVMLLTMFLGGMFYIWGSTFIIFFFSYVGAKRSITVPRMGYVEFKQSRRVRIILLVLILLILNLALFLFMAFDLLTPELNAFLNQHGLLVIGATAGGLFAFFGWVVQIYRLSIYGAVAFLVFFVSYAGVLHLAIPVIVFGLVIATTGFVLLSQFLRQYPRTQSNGEPYDDWETD